ncbi:MAG: hypothetical protein WC231_04930 [Dehalococcoidales bacterium]|jgi:hypothetical protein|nr:hypothetical protein [Dehalococcoidales bacterium]MDD5605430.1 hypothetical protein [Dehalococcoidales bacterium]MDX9986364.1 hypothetical protein [Dehalococcoidales bacterium]
MYLPKTKDIALLFTHWGLLCMILCGCTAAPVEEPPSVFPCEVSLEQASSLIGTQVPAPKDMPEGYSVQSTIMSDNRTVVFYIVKADRDYSIELSIQWEQIPLRILNAPRIYINDTYGYFIDRDEHNLIHWNLMPLEQPVGNEGLFELGLLAPKNIPTGELQLIAESITW